jgi:hypothetical protein
MKKELSVWDLKDMLWAKFESFYDMKDNQLDPKATWEDLADMCLPKNVDKNSREIAILKMRFEVKYVFRSPNNKTMKWLYGEHAMLYDVFGCKEHRFICTTHDDERFSLEQTIFCPKCNEPLFHSEKMRDEYIKWIDGEYLDEAKWNMVMKTSKWFKKYNTRQNLRYHFQKWFRKGYFIYRLKKFLHIKLSDKTK